MKLLNYLLAGTVLLATACSKDETLDNSCSDDGYSQNIVDSNIFVVLPNVITPNGDGRNEQFYIVALYKNPPSGIPTPEPVFTVRQLKVVEPGSQRVVYSATNYNGQFDGHDSQGAVLPEGKYHYEVTLDNNTAQGTLKIVRTTTACSCRAHNLTDPLIMATCP